MEEEEILKFWEKNKIYDKVKKKNEMGKKFYFMDGPPYATGSIHMGTALNKILKDIAMRSRRIMGYNVFDRPGYDTHGVPIEYQIEKELHIETKQGIEIYGVKKFIERCKDFATKYIDVMNSEFANLGVWMDWKAPYITLSDEYIEAIWWTFKKADEKKLLYLGKYPVHACPRCATAVAFNEIEYRKQDDNAIYVKFPLKNENKKFLVIWTTTPWTLPGNTAIIVHPEIKYVEVRLSNGEVWILAKELLGKIVSTIGIGCNVVKEFLGKELEGKEYENPLKKYLEVKTKNAYLVILSGRYVNLEEGTGLVHCAPGHGKEDFDAAKPYGIDVISPVDINGVLTKETGKYSGKRARVVDEEIIADLQKDNNLVYKHQYSHDYPVCWRCKHALLMISLPQWFFKISEVQKKLLRENEKIEWQPKWTQSRMKAWLEGIGDWPISRQRYWGTPLPIWICEKCNNKHIIGSVEELEKLSGKPVKSVHKPEIDEITIRCKCNGVMKRVPEVLDVWFDSGVSSWAALNFPQEKRLFDKFWPADLNIEGTDQFRGWWNSQFILSEIAFGKKPMNTIVVHGLVLDLGKKKMSKSLGNVVAPKDVIAHYGRDYLRYYFAKLSKGENFSYDETEFNEIKNMFRILENLVNFLLQLDKTKIISIKNVEDKWILSCMNTFLKEAELSYKQYKFFNLLKIAENFVIKKLSKVYIQMIRERADETAGILEEIICNVLKVLSPVIPFTTEILWRNLKNRKIVKEESVHLAEFPKYKDIKIDAKLEKEMSDALLIIENGLAERDKAKIGLRWPLAKASVKSKDKIIKEIRVLIARQLNVKKIEINAGKEISVSIDTKITPELEAEGFAREIARKVQALRKEVGMKKCDTVNLRLFVTDNLRQKLMANIELIKERTNSREIFIEQFYKNTDDKRIKIDKIKDENIGILFTK